MPHHRPRTTLIIPTLDRPLDLARCLQSAAPSDFDEIIVVEQGNLRRTRAVIERTGLPAVRLLHHTQRSAATARNLAIADATGDLLFFVDDDCVLDRRYAETAIEHFAAHPGCVGLTGRVHTPAQSSRLKRAVKRVLLMNAPSLHVLRSGENPLPHDDRTGTLRDIQWMPSHSSAYRRIVFDAGFAFDERLIRWSFGEDVMLSHQVYKHYGRGSLAYVPAYVLHHHESPETSLTGEAAIRMQVIYRFLFWHEQVRDHSTLTLCHYLYGQIGHSVRILYQHRHIPLRTRLRTLGASYRYLLAHHQAIARGHSDYNRFIMGIDPARPASSNVTSTKQEESSIS